MTAKWLHDKGRQTFKKSGEILPVDDTDELLQFLLSSLPVLVIGVGVSTLQNGQLESLLEFLCGAWRGRKHTRRIKHVCEYVR